MFTDLFSTNGRIGRTQYAISVIMYIGIVAFIRNINKHNNPLLQFAELPLLWFLISRGTRRCHDINTSGWYQLIPLYFLMMLFKEGNPDANQFGPSPKEAVSTPVSSTVAAVPQSVPVNSVPPYKVQANAAEVAGMVNSLQTYKEQEKAALPGQTIIEIENVTHSLVLDVLKKIRQLQKVSGFSYKLSGNRVVVTVNHEDSTHELLDNFYTLMPGIAVMHVNAGSLSLKIK